MSSVRNVRIPYSIDLSLGSYYSPTFDVIGWTDEGDESILQIVATFVDEQEARSFATKGGSLIVRPPSRYVRPVMEWIATLGLASFEGVELRKSDA